MPNKIKSAKQFRFFQAAAGGNLKGVGGPSPDQAKEVLSKEDDSAKSKFARAIRRKK